MPWAGILWDIATRDATTTVARLVTQDRRAYRPRQFTIRLGSGSLAETGFFLCEHYLLGGCKHHHTDKGFCLQ